jgi:Iron-sulfur cluster assembly protein
MMDDVKHPEAEDAAVADAARPADAPEKPAAIPAEEMSRLTDEIVGALKTVYDPEIPADIYELGLISP